MYTIRSLKIFSLLFSKKIKSSREFYNLYKSEADIDNLEIDASEVEKFLQTKDYNLICVYDEDFPKISSIIKQSEKPILIAYKGDISLIKTDNNNVAVIGVLNPDENIKKREEHIVKKLLDCDMNIVSGLAHGCDTVAHKICLENHAKTIAILPTTFENIYPKENKNLVDEIVSNNGLVLTEYLTEPQNKYESIKRFIDRDRLQAMFAKAIVLIASFRQGQGDSGSCHAMEKAKIYNKQRFVMFNKNTDLNTDIFGLNQEIISDGATVLTEKSIMEIRN